jgi:hypothetical protein
MSITMRVDATQAWLLVMRVNVSLLTPTVRHDRK